MKSQHIQPEFCDRRGVLRRRLTYGHLLMVAGTV
jgi:hypothetical protein